MIKRKSRTQPAIRCLFWAGSPFSVSMLRFMDLTVPVVRIQKLKEVL